MNKVIACAGLAAVGSVALQAQGTAEADSLEGKSWKVSATVRGFYDDNMFTAPRDSVWDGTEFVKVPKQKSWGVDVSPGFSLELLRSLTTVRFSANYDARWYEGRQTDQWDQSAKADLAISHSFSERFKVDVLDSFVYSSEPSVIADVGQLRHVSLGENLRNYGAAGFTGMLTEQLGTHLGYGNTVYDYKDSGNGSLSALLDRMEQSITADVRWKFQEKTTAMLGYQYGIIDYSRNDLLARVASDNEYLPANAPRSSTRNQQSHYMFLGLDQKFSPQFGFLARAGAQIAEYPNALPGMEDQIVAPYVDAALTYEYKAGSSFQIGAKNELGATDVAMADPYSTAAVCSQQATSVYAAVTHQITPKLKGFLRGSWQHGVFEGGGYDGKSEDFLTADVNLSYQINTHLAAEAGYAFDYLSSDVPVRGYERNRFYLGLKATY